MMTYRYLVVLLVLGAGLAGYSGVARFISSYAVFAEKKTPAHASTAPHGRIHLMEMDAEPVVPVSEDTAPRVRPLVLKMDSILDPRKIPLTAGSRGKPRKGNPRGELRTIGETLPKRRDKSPDSAPSTRLGTSLDERDWWGDLQKAVKACFRGGSAREYERRKREKGRFLEHGAEIMRELREAQGKVSVKREQAAVLKQAMLQEGLAGIEAYFKIREEISSLEANIGAAELKLTGFIESCRG